MVTVGIVDETTVGERRDACHLEIFEECLPLREVIHRRVDPQEQYVRVVEAFSRNGFVALVDDRQVEDLDARIELRAGTEITFLKLVPLSGG